MSLFENVRRCRSYDECPGPGEGSIYETDRCHPVNDPINPADLSDKEKIHQLKEELLPQGFSKDSFSIPPFQIDCGCRLFAGKNVSANQAFSSCSPGPSPLETVSSWDRKWRF